MRLIKDISIYPEKIEKANSKKGGDLNAEKR